MIRETQAVVLGVAEGLPHELCDVGVSQAVVHAGTLSAGPDQVGPPEQGEVATDRALWLAQCLDQPHDAALAAREQQHELSPGGFGQGLEDLADPRQVFGVGRRRNGMLVHGVMLAVNSYIRM